MVRCRYNPENIETLEQYVQFQVCVFNIALVSAMPYLQHLGPGGGKEGN